MATQTVADTPAADTAEDDMWTVDGAINDPEETKVIFCALDSFR